MNESKLTNILTSVDVTNFGFDVDDVGRQVRLYDEDMSKADIVVSTLKSNNINVIDVQTITEYNLVIIHID